MNRFTVSRWRHEPKVVANEINQKFGDCVLAVRSSSRREDGSIESNAGAFLSILAVAPNEIESAITRVVSSYGTAAADDDEVLVQPMLDDVESAGVAFSHDPTTCAPYRVISWESSGRTDVVTSGEGGRTWQGAADSPYEAPEAIRDVLLLVAEVSGLFGDVPVDIEFAFAKHSGRRELWLLQARPLVLSRKPERPEDQRRRLAAVSAKVAAGIDRHPFLKGRRTVFGVMPDWNPAEIIGVRPKPLALSLYRDLVTDSIWAYQRHNYGYRNLRSFPLLQHFFGLPYIDVRLSFNSFVPASLEDGLADRLVDYYLDRLLEQPALHDKVEFEIVFSCYALDLPERLAALPDEIFSNDDRRAIESSLRHLTNSITRPKSGLWRLDAAKLDVLDDRRDLLAVASVTPVQRIYWLLEDAKRYGTLPFAGLARAGFVAIQLLRSLVAVGVLSDDDYHAFLGSVSTVSGQLSRDRYELDRTSFLARYGHLRPGTYDILSPRYDEAPDLYFDWDRRPEPPRDAEPFSLTLEQMRDLAGLLDQHELDLDPVSLFEFIEAGIQLRESAKFRFTRNLSDALTLIAAYGGDHGFSVDDMAYCEISAFHELHASAADPADVLGRSIQSGKRRFEHTTALSLPPLISEVEDVWGFEWPEHSPNFVTQGAVTAPVGDVGARDSLNGAIVCIENADPGYDWLFSFPIAGLITAWGGVNSHMAIRAGELGLPAVIGAGEALYAQWAAARRLHIDCGARKVDVLE
jgi:hypothetical protein